jgi:hypothetical protein
LPSASQIRGDLARRIFRGALECSDRSNLRSCRARLAPILEASGIDRVRAVVDNGTIKIFVGRDRDVLILNKSFPALVDQVLRRELDRTREQVLSQVNSFLAEIAAFPVNLEERLLRILPDYSFDQEIEKLVNQAKQKSGKSNAEIVAGILAVGGDASRKKSLDETIAFNVATTAVVRRPEAGSSAAAQPLTAQSPSGNSAGSDDAAMRAVALQALAMTGPYGAAVALAVQVFSAIGQMNDLADQINKLAPIIRESWRLAM